MSRFRNGCLCYWSLNGFILKNSTGIGAPRARWLEWPNMLSFRPDQNIKVWNVLASCQTAEVSWAAPEQNTEDGVTGPDCHCSAPLTEHSAPPSENHRSPACGAAFSLIDLHATSPEAAHAASSRLLVRSSRGAAGQSGAQVDSGAADPGARTTRRVTTGLRSWPRRERQKGAWKFHSDRSMSAADVSFENTRAHFEVTGVHMMYTITRGPSKLVTQRRTGEWAWCNVSASQLFHQAYLN